MGKENFDQNTNERYLQDGFVAEDLNANGLQENFVCKTDLKGTNNSCGNDSTVEGANEFVITEEKVEEGASLGSYTDSAIADGVAVQGIFGSNLQVGSNTSEEEQRELMGQGIDALYEDGEESTAHLISANEFEKMTNVIDGKKRKPRKKKKRKTKVRKIVVKTYATVFSAVLCVVAIYFGVTFFSTTPPQGMEGADLMVNMDDLPHMVGTEGSIDLIKMFPNGSDFKKNSVPISNGILRINSLDGFELRYTQTIGEQTEEIKRQVEVLDGAVNVADWEGLAKAIEAERVICIQSAYIEAPPMIGTKVKQMSGFTLKNNLYGNGCKLNAFEIVCCRAKPSGGKLNTPYLQGNGPASGYTIFNIRPKDDGTQILMQDLHIIGNDMSTEPGGNLEGVSEVLLEKRGLNLFSAYGHLIAIEGNTSIVDGGEKGPKANFKLKHCVLENGHQVMHIRHSRVELEGNIIRNASDSTISVATYANEASTITSKNNVLANALTGGVVFYCYDNDITTTNAQLSWNVLDIVEGSFLDIYNWKLQDGLAFMPETEDFASVANPVAKSEIPKTKYDSLKADMGGKKYIHFAIVKLRTGTAAGAVPINGSYVNNYQLLGYQTTRDKGYEDGFPLPKVAASIITDIDVWGYYEKGDLDVTPTAVLNQETTERLYKELKYGRVKQ